MVIRIFHHLVAFDSLPISSLLNKYSWVSCLLGGCCGVSGVTFYFCFYPKWHIALTEREGKPGHDPPIDFSTQWDVIYNFLNITLNLWQCFPKGHKSIWQAPRGFLKCKFLESHLKSTKSKSQKNLNCLRWTVCALQSENHGQERGGWGEGAGTAPGGRCYGAGVLRGL